MEYETFVTPEIAIQLKELGFDWECDGAYDSVVDNINFHFGFCNHNNTPGIYSLPTLSTAQQWLRDVLNISVEVALFVPTPYWDDGTDWDAWFWEVKFFKGEHKLDIEGNDMSDNYEDALLGGIKYALNKHKERLENYGKREQETQM